jgi:hypothetical protein
MGAIGENLWIVERSYEIIPERSRDQLLSIAALIGAMSSCFDFGMIHPKSHLTTHILGLKLLFTREDIFDTLNIITNIMSQ